MGTSAGVTAASGALSVGPQYTLVDPNGSGSVSNLNAEWNGTLAACNGNTTTAVIAFKQTLQTWAAQGLINLQDPSVQGFVAGLPATMFNTSPDAANDPYYSASFAASLEAQNAAFDQAVAGGYTRGQTITEQQAAAAQADQDAAGADFAAKLANGTYKALPAAIPLLDYLRLHPVPGWPVPGALGTSLPLTNSPGPAIAPSPVDSAAYTEVERTNAPPPAQVATIDPASVNAVNAAAAAVANTPANVLLMSSQSTVLPAAPDTGTAIQTQASSADADAPMSNTTKAVIAVAGFAAALLFWKRK